jgi:type II secretory pathway pseudopilin PulG
MLNRKPTDRQRGETLIEVLLAFAILGIALVTVMRTMDGGLSSMFVSGQRSQVEAQMRGQLAVLQAAHQKAVTSTDQSTADWTEIINAVASTTSDREADVNADGCTYTSNKNRLYFTTDTTGTWTGDVATKTGGTMVPDSVTPGPDGSTLWIEAQHVPQGTSDEFARGYYDFYIKSCWMGANNTPQQAKMITRFYDLAPTSETPDYNDFTFIAGPAASAPCSNVSGANGRISYTITNGNSFDLGTVRISINGANVRDHTVTANGTANGIVSDTAPAGYPVGSYTVRATVLATGEFKEVSPVRIEVCPPSPITVLGSNHGGNCRPLANLEGDERPLGATAPSAPFLSNPPPHPYPCRTSPAPFNTVFACVNYDVQYNPNVVVGGRYRMILRYFDANCGDASNENLSVLGYNYRIEVYVNGVRDSSMSLVPGAPILTYPHTFTNPLPAGAQIGLRWWNNRFIDPGMRDPDFVIQNFTLEYLP